MSSHPHPDADRRSPGGRGHLGERAVARIGYGTMQIEHLTDRAAALAMLATVADSGIDHLDTAEFYTGVNALIAEALGSRRDALSLATKVGATRTPAGELIPGQKPQELRAQVEANLASLNTDHLDLVYLRRVDRRPGIVAEGDQVVDLEDQLAELIALREAGKVGGIGLSAVDEDQLTGALGAGIVAVQNSSSLVQRDADPLLEICRSHGITWVPFFPLGGAFPGSPKVTEQPLVRQIAAELGATPAQVGLAWQLARYEDTLLIPGTRSPEHLAENLAAGDVVLSAAQLEALDAIEPA